MAKRTTVTLLLLVTVLTLSLCIGLGPVFAEELGSRTLKEGLKGDDVKKLQTLLKGQGYFKENVTGFFGSKTKEAVTALQKAKGLKSDGIAGPSTIKALMAKPVNKKRVSVSRGATAKSTTEYTVKDGDSLWTISRNAGTTVEMLTKLNNLSSDELTIGQRLILPAQSANNTTAAATSQGGYGEAADWWTDAQYAFPIGTKATVRDVDTGKTFKIKRSYGVNHADCEPLTADDTAVMKELFPTWGWDTRAIVIEVGDRKIAASMSGMPHSIETIGESNSFNGHFDIHFLNSRSHNTNKVRPEHQAMVKKAAGQ